MHPNLESDEDLVRRAKSGEHDAFGLLMKKYERRVFRLVSRLVSNPSEAEDVVQETFIKVFHSLEGFRGDALFFTWLYRVAVNAAKNELRESKKRASLHGPMDILQSETDDGLLSAADPNTPESLLAAKQAAQLVEKALDRVPWVCKTALVLREVDGLSYEEIAIIMACPVGTVRSRIFRARELVAHRLAAESFYTDGFSKFH